MMRCAASDDSGTTAVNIAPNTITRAIIALKHDDALVVADAFGDILGDGDGLFLEDTRILSRFCLTLGGQAPSLLGASVSEDNVRFTAHLSNRPLPMLGGPGNAGGSHSCRALAPAVEYAAL